MLLRLRQACDHPLLVRGCGSSSAWFSSVEMAKKISPEKRTSLLNCLEDSLAICGICNVCSILAPSISITIVSIEMQNSFALYRSSIICADLYISDQYSFF